MSIRATFAATAMALTVLVPTAPGEAQEAGWLQVRVHEADEQKVSLRLPLSLVEVGLDVAFRNAVEPEALRWDEDRKVTLDDLRRMWAELEAAGDTELVEVVDDDARIRVAREGDRVRIHVREGDDTRARVEMPSTVVDALLGTEGDHLDIQAAMRELTRAGDRDLVDIRDGDTSVRIWIGENEPAGSPS